MRIETFLSDDLYLSCTTMVQEFKWLREQNVQYNMTDVDLPPGRLPKEVLQKHLPLIPLMDNKGSTSQHLGNLQLVGGVDLSTCTSQLTRRNSFYPGHKSLPIGPEGNWDWGPQPDA